MPNPKKKSKKRRQKPSHKTRKKKFPKDPKKM